MKTVFKSIRADLGGLALGLGAIGLFLCALGIPLAGFTALVCTGASSQNGSTHRFMGNQSAEEDVFGQLLLNRLLPLLVISLLLTGYGFYETFNEKKTDP
jgi:hypothetical protein